ncbi:MAG: hypothetical protein WDN72_09575 [Alphaproteobacteria bacterium]
MVAASHICTHCGYEGSPIRLPGDGSGEDESLAVDVLNKLFFAATFIPLKFGWIVRLAKRGKAKTCPNCGLPLMVRLNSDAGFIAKRKQEVKAGLLKFEGAEESPGATRSAPSSPSRSRWRRPSAGAPAFARRNAGDVAGECRRSKAPPRRRQPPEPAAEPEAPPRRPRNRWTRMRGNVTCHSRESGNPERR